MYRAILGAMSHSCPFAHVTAVENRYPSRGVKFFPQCRSRVSVPSLLRPLAGHERFACLAVLHGSLAVIYGTHRRRKSLLPYTYYQTNANSSRYNLSQTSLSRTARIPKAYCCSTTRLHMSKCIGWQRRDLLRDYAYGHGSAPGYGATRNTRCRCRQSGLLRPSRCLPTGDACWVLH